MTVVGAGDSGALPLPRRSPKPKPRKRCVGSRVPVSKISCAVVFAISYYLTCAMTIIPHRLDHYIFQTLVWVTAVARRRISRVDRSAMKVRLFG